MGRQSTLVIGAAGSIGRRLCAALAHRGDNVIAADKVHRFETSANVRVFMDVRENDSVQRVFRNHDTIDVVWNLAAPLSIETARDPANARSTTVGGMQNVLAAMTECGVRKLCFTDTIASFGQSAPRLARARWLTRNPTQDPGSDYGMQKRECRDMLRSFTQRHNGDTRFAILPGVLHGDAAWGNGTTEYVLDALLAASRGEKFSCPIDTDVKLPMAFVDDIIIGLLQLQDARKETLLEPEGGYALAGVSFTAEELFDEIKKHFPRFKSDLNVNQTMNTFAHTWPDKLSHEEGLRDLKYKYNTSLEQIVEIILAIHSHITDLEKIKARKERRFGFH